MRAGSTYRASRRNAWAFARKRATISWREWNVSFYRHAGFGILGEVRSPIAEGATDRSKYMPHIGAKERGRYA